MEAKTKIQKFKVAGFLLAAVFLAGCSTFSSSSNLTNFTENPEKNSFEYVPEIVEWSELYPGFSYFYYENKNFPLRYHCVKVDLKNPELKISGYPKKEQEIHQGITVKTLNSKLKKENKNNENKPSFQMIVNTSPFAGKNGKWDIYAHIFSYRNIVGIHKVENKIFSKSVPKYAAIAFKSDNKAVIFDSQRSDEEFSDYHAVFGGFFTTLRDFQIRKFPQIQDSRTAFGLTQDGYTLFVLIVEAERKHYSRGLSYPECSEIFLKLGAADAIQMDGGGSACLFINGKNYLSYSTIRKNASFIVFEQ